MSTEAPAAIPSVTPTPTPTPSGISEPWAKSWIKEDFSLDHSALDRLPDHLKGMKDTLSKYGKFEDVLTSYQSVQSLAGKKALAPLPPDAPDHVRAERKALLAAINGVPSDAKGYGIAKPADLPDQHWDQAMADNYANWAHENNVPPAAAKKLMDLQLGSVKSALAAEADREKQFWAKEQQDFEARIKAENIPNDRANALVEKGIIAFGLDPNNEQTKIFMQGSNARMMAMKHAMAIGEDTTITNGNNGNGGVADPAALARDIISNPSNPLHAAYWNKGNKFSRADQESAVEKVSALNRQAVEKQERAPNGQYRR